MAQLRRCQLARCHGGARGTAGRPSKCGGAVLRARSRGCGTSTEASVAPAWPEYVRTRARDAATRSRRQARQASRLGDRVAGRLLERGHRAWHAASAKYAFSGSASVASTPGHLSARGERHAGCDSSNNRTALWAAARTDIGGAGFSTQQSAMCTWWYSEDKKVGTSARNSCGREHERGARTRSCAARSTSGGRTDARLGSSSSACDEDDEVRCGREAQRDDGERNVLAPSSSGSCK
ncbi:hypothetical protein DMC30DRAFT_110214 [Rhodotorula diobovata]|uniref:Uncharacterized protein n=1 Tax=Rhodotorula diobovata TaxID=5288 RepID=A0A5C5G607_9BASI|nr:hypothetical protein DMC30DRAFT_110214 [Rhodotorula diobovata]